MSEASGKKALRVVTTGDGSRTLTHPRAGQTYGSERGALSEARQVFLHASGVAARLQAGTPTTVIEVGLGTGLNLLVSAAVATRTGTPLRYLALESDPPPPAIVAALGYQNATGDPALTWAWLHLLDALHTAVPGRTLRFGPGCLPAPVTLQVALGDAAAPDGAGPSTLAHQVLRPESADAVYHDAFSPDAEPRLWSEAFLRALAATLRPGGRFVTYTVAGQVRRALQGAGLQVAKVPGPAGGKRESLVATRPAS